MIITDRRNETLRKIFRSMVLKYHLSLNQNLVFLCVVYISSF